MVFFEGTRIDYGEQRMIGVGLLDYLVVLIVHVENEETIRIISMRKAVRGRIAKQRISIMLDAPIIARYKAIAGERGYQTLINDTLRRAVEGEYFVQAMRNAIREELVEYAIEKKRGKS
jgi:Ribonuclease toxin, BrnT, of type II toxin-antitoxin system/BrnA antitoxin of type II toxin-antitoxin system